MIGSCIVWVWYAHKAPYKHKHVWMSEGWMYAPVELMEWKRELEEDTDNPCAIKIIEWYLKERTDIGW